MKAFARYRAIEEACRRHAELDEKTASRWLEEAELWSKLVEIEYRLQILGEVQPGEKGSGKKVRAYAHRAR